MAGRFFLPAVFLRGGKVLMKKREWKRRCHNNQGFCEMNTDRSEE